MLNVQVFNDIDGDRVEIDRRDVRHAYLEGVGGQRLVVIIEAEAGRTVKLGAGARDFIEAWLGRKLEVVSKKGAPAR